MTSLSLLLLYTLRRTPFRLVDLIVSISVGSHSPHVLYARELGETSIYVADTAAENRRIKHPSTNNAYVLQYSDTRAR